MSSSRLDGAGIFLQLQIGRFLSFQWHFSTALPFRKHTWGRVIFTKEATCEKKRRGRKKSVFSLPFIVMFKYFLEAAFQVFQVSIWMLSEPIHWFVKVVDTKDFFTRKEGKNKLHKHNWHCTLFILHSYFIYKGRVYFKHRTKLHTHPQKRFQTFVYPNYKN